MGAGDSRNRGKTRQTMESRENKQQSIRRCKRDRAMLAENCKSKEERVTENVHQICGLGAETGRRNTTLSSSGSTSREKPTQCKGTVQSQERTKDSRARVVTCVVSGCRPDRPYCMAHLPLRIQISIFRWHSTPSSSLQKCPICLWPCNSLQDICWSGPRTIGPATAAPSGYPLLFPRGKPPIRP